jgi:signal recognition particle GTPase
MATGFFRNFISRFTGGPVDWEELEETLIRADFGISMTSLIIEALKKRAALARIQHRRCCVDTFYLNTCA